MFIFHKKRFLAWIFLFLAIIFEVIATSFLKLESLLGVGLVLCVMSVFIGVSYYFMALSLKELQVGIAYALWELLGTLAIVLIALFFFDEILSLTQIFGIILAFVGIILINFGALKQ